MKKTIFAMIMTVALFGCEEANKAVDQAQEAANKAAESMKETASEAMDTVEETASDAMESVEKAAGDAADAMSMRDSFDYDQFAASSPEAKAFSDSVQEAMEVDFSNPQAVDSATNRVANTYKCYADTTSQSEAQNTISSMLSSLKNDSVKSLVQSAINDSKDIYQCVM